MASVCCGPGYVPLKAHWNRQAVKKAHRCFGLPWCGVDMDIQQAHMAIYCEVMMDERLAWKYPEAMNAMRNRDRLVERMCDVYAEITTKDRPSS